MSVAASILSTYRVLLNVRDPVTTDAIVSIVFQVLTLLAVLVVGLKRQPSLERDVFEKFLSRGELDKHETRNDEALAALSRQILENQNRFERTSAETFHQLRVQKADYSQAHAVLQANIQTSLNNMATQIGTLSGKIEVHLQEDLRDYNRST